MTQQMERNKKIALLVLLAVLQVLSVRTEDCPDQPDQNLTCHTDYNHSITCVWNSAYEHREALCTLHAKRLTDNASRAYNASCNLEPAHVSGPALRKCTLDFKTSYKFQAFHILSINLECAPAKQILTICFKPSCHIKLHPPGEPGINGTTASWISEVEKHERIKVYTGQLQWKRWDQSWSDPSVQTKQTKSKSCELNCTAQLDDETLTLGEKHEARVRVKSNEDCGVSTWSEWSPTASWVSPVGIRRPPSQLISSLTGGILAVIIGGAALASILAVILFRTEKASCYHVILYFRVYEKMRGPDPGKSFLKDVNFQNWLSPHLANESFLSSRKVEDISSVEVVSSVDAATLCSKEVALLAKMRSESLCQLTSSIFLNPSYSHLCPPPPFPLPSACDAPHSLGDGKNAEQVREEERMKELEMLLLLSKGNSSSEPLPVVSDYEKVEKLQVEGLRLQRLDSGMCSGEEVSQESLEADNINANKSHDKAPEENKGGIGPVDFQKLFGVSGSAFGKGSIQVCSDYEQVQRLQPESPELPSQDSGVSSGGEERASHDESLEDEDKSSESTHFLFPPPLASSALPRSGISFPQQFSGLSPSPSLRPSGDGYMPVKQEPC
ncbi:interleukin-2 receptor subunit beta isoform X2 [Pleuronectes platessa]|uniref:interleukin-2 receptor subunit beta isoform X2 n=1 Tax=Pleuronectes platessa TaxID=8262 RepID=UPI00232A3BC7|nr:interleukin-2 receptor subunit beta isoform X2 [Pleuronectes platessa]